MGHLQEDEAFYEAISKLEKEDREGLHQLTLPHEEKVYPRALRRSPQAQVLIAAYKASPPSTNQEKARFEKQIWGTVEAKARKSIIRVNGYGSKFLAYALGSESTNSYIARSRTLDLEEAGMPVQLLWELIDRGEHSKVLNMISYAKKAMEEAYASAKDKLDEASTLQFVQEKCLKALTQYGVLPVSDRKKVAASAKEGAKTPKKLKAFDELLVNGDSQEAKDILNYTEALISEKMGPFTRTRLDDLESESTICSMTEDLMEQIRHCFEDHLKRIRRIRNLTISKEILKVKREKIRWALEVLRIEVKHGWKKEDLDKQKIKKAYRQLVGIFHPDKNGGSDRYKQQLTEVQEAYGLLHDVLNM